MDTATQTAVFVPPVVHLGKKLGNRAFGLDWDAKPTDRRSDITPEPGMIGTLREIFQAKRLKHLQLMFGPEASLEMVQSFISVLERIEQAGGGESLPADLEGQPGLLSSLLPTSLVELFYRVIGAFGGSAGDAARRLRSRLYLASQYAVIDTLKVETSSRYQKVTTVVDGKTKTYCNVYGSDVSLALGGYLPRVFWYDPSIKRMKKGEEVKVEYGNLPKGTVGELSANALHAWLNTWGEYYGWERAADMYEAQEAANNGSLVVIVAKHNRAGHSGHVTVLLAESPADYYPDGASTGEASRYIHTSPRDVKGNMLAPLQSQAGSRNFAYGGKRWWDDAEHTGGPWIYRGSTESPIATAEELGRTS
jgi:hypothetical protein